MDLELPHDQLANGEKRKYWPSRTNATPVAVRVLRQSAEPKYDVIALPRKI